jgi:Bacterial pre-peptidase C-terminal domain
MVYPSSDNGFASTPDLAVQNRLTIQASSPLKTHPENSQRKPRQRASDKGNLSGKGFQFLKPYLQIQSSGNQTIGGNTIGNAQNLGNLSGKIAYSRNDAVGSSNLSDFYKFTLSKPSDFGLKLGKLTGNADLWLLKSNGDRIAKSSRSGTKSESIGGRLKAGTYYVQVATEDNAASYSLDLKGSGKSSDAGNSQAAALDAGNLSRTQRRYKGQVGGTDSDDYYRVDLSEGGSLKAIASGISGDIDLQLFNSSGVQLSKSTANGGANESLSQTVAAGTYYLRVSPFNSGKSNYTLDLSSNYTGKQNDPVSPTPNPSSSPNPSPSPNPTPNPTGDPGNSLSTAEVRSSATFSRTQQVSKDDTDFYRFNVTQSGVFKADLTGLSGDADVKLIQDTNNNGAIDQGEVKAWQWEWGTTNESIRKFLQPGTYYVGVNGYGSAMKDYTLNTNFAPQASDDRKFSIQLNYSNAVSATVKDALNQAAKTWESAIAYSSFNGPQTLNINVTGVDDSQQWLAAAKNTDGQTDANGRWMPIAGNMKINTSYTNTFNNNPQYVKDIVTHEMGHVLGIGTLWETHGRNLIDDATDTYQANSYAGKAYGEVLGTFAPTAVPVEVGTHGHWSENTFNAEMMTPYAESVGTKLPLSEITIASLRDLGWNVNFGAAETYSV